MERQRREGGAARGIAGAGLLVGGLAAAGFLAQTAQSLWAGGLWRVDGVVAFAVVVLGGLLALWYALTGLALVLAALTRRGLGIARWGAPIARRLAVGAAVTAIGVGSVPAIALPDSPELPEDLTLGGLVLVQPERDAGAVVQSEPGHDGLELGMGLGEQEHHAEASATTEAKPREETDSSMEPGAHQGPEATPELSPEPEPAPTVAATHEPASTAAATAPAHEPTREPSTSRTSAPEPARTPDPVGSLTHADVHVVASGECLWWIAEEELPAHATDAQIWQRVGEWVEANPELRPNPDLIMPGQNLRIPGSTP